MAVLKRFRTPAKMEFFANAYRLRKELFLFMARDFGVKGEVRTLEVVTHGMSAEDRAAFMQIAGRYHVTDFGAKYPEWIVAKFRDSIWDTSRALLHNLTSANSIFPTIKIELHQRRVYQDYALGNCNNLLHELQFLFEMFPISAKGYMPYVELIEREITLIKGWRRNDLQRFKALP